MGLLSFCSGFVVGVPSIGSRASERVVVGLWRGRGEVKNEWMPVPVMFAGASWYALGVSVFICANGRRNVAEVVAGEEVRSMGSDCVAGTLGPAVGWDGVGKPCSTGVGGTNDAAQAEAAALALSSISGSCSLVCLWEEIWELFVLANGHWKLWLSASAQRLQAVGAMPKAHSTFWNNGISKDRRWWSYLEQQSA